MMKSALATLFVAFVVVALPARADQVRWYEGALLGVGYTAILADYSTSLAMSNPRNGFGEAGFPMKQIFGYNPTRAEYALVDLTDAALMTLTFAELPPGWRCIPPAVMILIHGRSAIGNIQIGTGFRF